MEIPQDARFRDERERFALRFTCEDCEHFVPLAQRCSHGFPVERHLRQRYENPEASLLFCKDFALI